MKIITSRRLLTLFGIVFLLTACQEEPEADLTGEFGNGSGGTAVSETQALAEITNKSGDVIATYKYDTDFFDAFPGDDPVFQLLSDTGDEGIFLLIARIFGRPDTACRYMAAVMARDENYEIDLTGERENAQAIEIYQVELHQGSIHRGLFCADLIDNIGISISVQSTSKAILSYEQIYFILNSITVL
jgi:hypothetical protein